MSNLLLGSPDHCLLYHSIIGDMIFFCYNDMSWSSFILFSHYLPLFSHHIFPNIYSTFYHFPTFIHLLDAIPSSHHSHVLLIVWLFLISFFSPSMFHLIMFRFMAHEIFHALHLIHEDMGLITGYLSLVSLHLFTLSP